MYPFSTATYVNHDNWPSLIGIEDDTAWETSQTSTPSFGGTDNGDGKTTATLTLTKAGTYSLKVEAGNLVEGIAQIIGSPKTFEVRPSTLDPTSSVAFEVPEIITAGFEYEFSIQGRDIYKNNVDYLLKDAIVIEDDFSV